MTFRRSVSAVALLAALTLTPAFAGDAASTTAPAAPSTTAQRYGTWGVDLEGMDRSVKPGDDFFKYVNGKWAATTQIPPDRTSYGAFPMLLELSELRTRGIIEGWAADSNLKAGSDEAKVAATYRTFLDEATVEKLDSKPLQPYLDAVRKATTRNDIARIMGRSAGSFGTSLIGNYVDGDLKNPDT